MSMIRFQAYFKKGLRYLSGGVKTGLSHYVEDKNPKLFHVKVIVSIFTITNIKLKSIYNNPTTSHACSVYRPSHCVHVHVVQGRRKPIVRQCMEISWAVMNRCRPPPCWSTFLFILQRRLLCAGRAVVKQGADLEGSKL